MLLCWFSVVVVLPNHLQDKGVYIYIYMLVCKHVCMCFMYLSMYGRILIPLMIIITLRKITFVCQSSAHGISPSNHIEGDREFILIFVPLSLRLLLAGHLQIILDTWQLLELLFTCIQCRNPCWNSLQGRTCGGVPLCNTISSPLFSFFAKIPSRTWMKDDRIMHNYFTWFN